MDKRFPTDISLKDQQRSMFKDIAKSISKTSLKFDLDTKGTKSNMDDLINSRVI